MSSFQELLLVARVIQIYVLARPNKLKINKSCTCLIVDEVLRVESPHPPHFGVGFAALLRNLVKYLKQT